MGLYECRSIQDIFELVKETVSRYLGRFPQGFIGAYYAPSANTIVINSRILGKVKNTYLYKPYIFHILLHEYIHSLGFYDEQETRQLTYRISKELDDPILIQLAEDMTRYFPELIYSHHIEPPEDISIEYLLGIDKKNLDYLG